MKKRIWLVLLSALLCLSMMFAGCEKVGNDPEGTTKPVDSDPPDTPTEDLPSDADKEVILSYLDSNNTDSNAGDLTSALKDFRLKISDLTMTTGGQTEKVMQSLVINRQYGELTMPNNQKVYLCLGSNGDLMITALLPDGTTQSKICDLGALYEIFTPATAAELPNASGMPALPDLSGLPELTADDLKYEGNGVYVIAEEYYSELLDQLVEAFAPMMGLPTSKLREVKAVLQSYLEDIDIRVAFTVENETITQVEFSVHVDSDLIAEIFEKSTRFSGIDEKMKLEFSVVIEYTGETVSYVGASVKAMIPTTPEEVDESSVAIGFVNVNAEMELHPEDIQAENATVAKVTCKAEQKTNLYHFNMDPATGTVKLKKLPSTLPASAFEMAMELNSKKAGELEMSLTLKADGQTQKIAMKIQLNDVPWIKLPDMVQKDIECFEDQYILKKGEISEKIDSVLWEHGDAVYDKIQENIGLPVCYQLYNNVYAVFQIGEDDALECEGIYIGIPYTVRYTMTIGSNGSVSIRAIQN